MVTLVHFTMEMYGGVANTTMQISTPGRCAALVAVATVKVKTMEVTMEATMEEEG